MIDFHSHILPEMDDGADSVETSLDMLRESFRQGVNVICATSHFYADEEDPKSFLRRRNAAYSRLMGAIENPEDYPRILLGAEVLYYPGICLSQEMRDLRLAGTPFLLIEPPMMRWSEDMLTEIELCADTLNCIPVIAHIDRYMHMFSDYTLFDRVKSSRILIQVNANFFLHHNSRGFALECLKEKRFQFIGSDCHNMDDRCPNIGGAEAVIREGGFAGHYANFIERQYRALGGGGRKT